MLGNLSGLSKLTGIKTRSIGADDKEAYTILDGVKGKGQPGTQWSCSGYMG